MPDTITGRIEMEDGGVITFELYHDVAPQSVKNFVCLARSGFYDGLTFHRIISGFMIQGGCPEGTGTGNPGYSILGEFEANGIENDLSHTRGVMSMARAGHDFNSAGSQFFVCHGDPVFLDGEYAAFGMVTEGMDVVDRLTETPVIDGNGSVAPEDRSVIRTIKIDIDDEVAEPDRIGR
ncbi:MAG: peptidylprolyl isomerase [Oscillospiraceae bacterium]|nr:peptidylprolyl isomerase [Oscillospiraceae bacterium]MCL2279161.1 peptidylprolyl isomerase [Oscillospiraceae bacterium]